MVGADVTDQSGNEHLGVIEFPVPILWGSPEIIKQIRMVLLRETTAEWSINRVNGQGPTEPCPLTFLSGIIQHRPAAPNLGLCDWRFYISIIDSCGIPSGAPRCSPESD